MDGGFEYLGRKGKTKKANRDKDRDHQNGSRLSENETEPMMILRFAQMPDWWLQMQSSAVTNIF